MALLEMGQGAVKYNCDGVQIRVKYSDGAAPRLVSIPVIVRYERSEPRRMCGPTVAVSFETRARARSSG